MPRKRLLCGKGAPAGGALGRRQDPEKNFWVSFSIQIFSNSELPRMSSLA
jgi:hypothetical protein